MILKAAKWIFLTALLCHCSDRRETHFHTFAEAKKAGFQEQGWIPMRFPTDAKNIKVAYNYDTNEGCLVYDYESTPFEDLDTSLVYGQEQILGGQWESVLEEYCGFTEKSLEADAPHLRTYLLEGSTEQLLLKNDKLKRAALLFRLRAGAKIL